ncbi:MAG: hypothetical protein M1814_005481 [Vezdaea aestivalis]|nr:MAG: hypothetical protein M1814_005481 [Vezdaea aestivalis]
MAPSGDYNPALGDVLSGRKQLMSWETAYYGFLETRFGQPDSILGRTLRDTEASSLLATPLKPFKPRTNNTKAALDAATAAINITPSTKCAYNLTELKEDALWLSEQCSIAENGALRVVVLEWQSRSARGLLYAGVQSTKATPFLGASSISQNAEAPSNDISVTLRRRRLRILKAYLSERRFILKMSEMTFQKFSSANSSQAQFLSRQEPNESWVQEVSNTVWNGRLGGERFIRDCLTALAARQDVLFSQTPLVKDPDLAKEIELSWTKNLILEIVHVMQLILLALDGLQTFPTAQTAESWFSFMQKFDFFAIFDPPHQSLRYLGHPLRSLAQIISVSLLKMPLIIKDLDSIEDFQVTKELEDRPELKPYILVPETIVRISEAFELAKSKDFLSPSMLSWTLLLLAVKQFVLEKAETRELQQSARAVSTFSVDGDDSTPIASDLAPDRSKAQSIEDLNLQGGRLADVFQTIEQEGVDTNFVQSLGDYACGEGRVFETITEIVMSYCGLINASEDGESSRIISLIFLELITSALSQLSYSSPIIQAILAIMSRGSRGDDEQTVGTVGGPVDPATAVLNNPNIMDSIFKPAISRFPYETVPFLRLVRAFTNSRDVDANDTLKTLSILNHMKTFTQLLPSEFKSYEVTDETKDGNFVILRAPIPLFRGHESGFRLRLLGSSQDSAAANASGSDSQSELVIPNSTMGRIVSEKGPRVGLWFFEYSGLPYLGRLLSTTVAGSRLVDYGTGVPADRQTAVEIVGLLADIMRNSSSTDPSGIDNVAARRILEEASTNLDRNQNIISVVFDVLEKELQEIQPQVDCDGVTDLLANCMQFVLVLIKVLPGRVWPYLAKSSLLGTHGLGGRLVPIVTSLEMPSGQFPFLLICIRVYQALVKDCTKNAIARKSTKKAGGRYNLSEGIGAGVNDQTMQKVLHAFLRIMVDVFQSCPNWKFTRIAERLQARSLLLDTFRNILSSVFAVDDRTELENKVLGILSPSALHLIDVFMNDNANSAITLQILESLNNGATTPSTTLFIPTFLQWTGEIRSTLALLTSLLQIRKMLSRPRSDFETQLFQNSAVFARLYTTDPTYRLPSLQVLEALVQGAVDSQTKDPPSLLGHMGLEVTQDFLGCLSSMDGVLSDVSVYNGIWSLLSTILSCNQQWFSVFLLTGGDPRDKLNVKPGTTAALTPVDQKSSKGLLFVALDSLSRLASMAKPKAIAILGFICQCEDHWAWALAELHNRSAILESLLKYVATIGRFIKSREASDSYDLCTDIQLAGLCIRVLGMYAHRSRQLSGRILSSSEFRSLEFFIDFATRTPDYNVSLHSNLKRNFEMKYPGFALTDFKRTTLSERVLGSEFFYDVQFASQLLGFEKFWDGLAGREGLAGEVRRANLNLSRVECQIALLKSWSALIIELSLFMKQDEGFQGPLIAVAKNCLSSNIRSNLPSQIFDRLSQTRADLVFVLAQKFTSAKIHNSDVLNILELIWENLRMNEQPLDVILTGVNAEYTRTLLRILLLALQAHKLRRPKQSQKTKGKFKSAQSASENTLQIVLDILTHLVGSGFQSLTTSIHENPKSIPPSDLAMLVALMQACFQIPGIEVFHPQIVTHLSNIEATRIAATLYSWSDRLTEENESSFGEIGIQFLLSMSSINMMAEHMAVEGTLALLSNARLTATIRKSAKFLGSRDIQLYSIWVRGILPLSLNFLAAVGPGVVSEVGALVAGFKSHISTIPSHLSSLVESKSDSSITLNLASEVHSLALLEAVFQRYRLEGPSIGLSSNDMVEIPWDKGGLQAALEACLSKLGSIRARVLATSELELELQARKARGGSYDNRLEEMIVAELEACERIIDYERDA